MRSPYEAFLQIVESGSITKACAELNISQPALSKQLRRLEDELKVPLFERTPNGVRLTVYGEALVAPARSMRDAGHGARMIVERLRQSFSGHVVFGVSPPVSFDFMPRVALELLTAAPGLDMTVIEHRPETLLEMVRRSEIEFAICSSYDGFGEEFVVRDILDDVGFIVASRNHEIFRNGRVEPQALVEHHWTGALRAYETRLAVKFRALGLTLPRMRVETLSVAQTIRLVEAGRFLTLQPSVAIRSQLADGRLVPVLPEVFSTQFNFKAVFLHGAALSPGGKIILETFLSVGRNL